MKILFLTNDMRVKHFHMASALRTNLDVEIFLLHILSRFGDLGALREYFPYPNRMWYYMMGRRTRLVGDAESSGIFDGIERFSRKTLLRLRPDVIYINESGIELTKDLSWRPKIVCDIEDSTLFDENATEGALKRELNAIRSDNVDFYLFGSAEEHNTAKTVYESSLKKPSRVQYPYVAASTLSRVHVDKTEEFSVVYAGSLFSGGCRDLFSLIEQFGKCRVRLDVYMLNDWTHHWKRLVKIHKKYPSVRAYSRLKLFEVKQVIQKYHAGLCIGGDFKKVKATFGMKPLEYAYAGVVPLGIITSGKEKRVRNLSNGRVFGYTTFVSRAEKDFVNLLHNFDWDYHLMDNHLDKFVELMA